jgi:hypothetical protein
MGDAHALFRAWTMSRPVAGVGEDEWFDARDAWWDRHFLRAGADGAYLPDVAFQRSDDDLIVTWGAAPLAGESAPQLLEHQGEIRLAWRESAKSLIEFVRQVGDWCADAGEQLSDVPAGEMRSPVGLVDGERLPPLARIEAYTAVQREELGELANGRGLRSILDWLGLGSEEEPAASPLAQALRDLAPGSAPKLREALSQLRGKGDENRPSIAIAGLRDTALDAAAAGERPEERGYFAAQAVRTELGLNGEPVVDLENRIEALGLAASRAPAGTAPERALVAGGESQHARVVVLDSERTRTRWASRFELARALGHLVLDPFREGVVGAASGRFALEARRRSSGAFAAEFLLPTAGLVESSGGVVDRAAEPERFQRLMHEYAVGARTAAWHLWNQGLISAESVREDLIEEFGHQRE